MDAPTAPNLLEHLIASIPLAVAMQVAVHSATADIVTLTAPLAPNINGGNTAFGGSTAALSLMAAWSLLHLRLEHAGLSSRIVTQSSSIEYVHPVTDVFSATASCEDGAAWDRFCTMLERRRRSRIAIASTLSCYGQETGALKGRFVAFLKIPQGTCLRHDAGRTGQRWQLPGRAAQDAERPISMNHQE